MKITGLNLYLPKISKNNNKTNNSNVTTTPIGMNFPQISQNYMNNINFRGSINWKAAGEYTHDLGKRIYSKRNVTELSKQHSDALGISIGRGLPEIWTNRIADIKNFDKDNFMKEYGEIFARERKFADVDELQGNLFKLFKKHKIVDDLTPFSVQYIGHGFQAWAFKINIDNDENSIVTKLFKRPYNYLQNHGNHTEQNLAEYVKKYAGDETEFVKYYYGDTKNGILLTNYISSDAESPKYTLNLEDIGLKYNDDKPENRKNGNLVDFGGLITDSNLMGTEDAIKILKSIKYAKSDAERLQIFNNIMDKKEDTDEFKDMAIGLTHSVKYMPEEIQDKLYKDLYDLGSHRVNISLIQNIKNFTKSKITGEISPILSKMIVELTTNVDDVKAQETIAKEIKNMPSDIVHKFFDEYADTKVSAIIKYLARHMNLYYKPMENRKLIYEKFIENSDRYSAISLISNMKFMSESRYDEYFEKFFAKNDKYINMTLARSLELFKNDEKLQKKWINKLMECDSVDIKAGLCESVSYVDKELRPEMFEKLLSTKDHVSKEFLATNIISVPGYEYHPEWIDKLLDGADNMVRGALVASINEIKAKNHSFNPARNKMIRVWTEKVSDGADSSIKAMLNS